MKSYARTGDNSKLSTSSYSASEMIACAEVSLFFGKRGPVVTQQEFFTYNIQVNIRFNYILLLISLFFSFLLLLSFENLSEEGVFLEVLSFLYSHCHTSPLIDMRRLPLQTPQIRPLTSNEDGQSSKTTASRSEQEMSEQTLCDSKVVSAPRY